MIDSGVLGQVGPYRLLREVGRGASGAVYEAIAPDGAVLALKVLTPPAFLSEAEVETVRRRFIREARALQAVDHPAVVRVTDWGEEEGRLYLAMEFLEGENLRQLLTRHGPFPVEVAVAFVEQLCGALDAVHHAGIVHRDVKPENLVVVPDGTLRLTDFGVAWMETEATLTQTGGVLGSPAYMAPEQILGQAVDRRADLFAASVTLYQLLTDTLPFSGSGLMEVAHKVVYSEPTPLPAAVPHPIARVIFQCLSKTPAARFATATELAQALHQAVLGVVPKEALPLPAAASQLPASAASTPAGALTVNLGATPIVAPVQAPPDFCARHPRLAAIARCRACGRPMCAMCARTDKPPYYCYVHAPVTLFGVNTVRMEVAMAALGFLLLLLCLSPLGYMALHH